MKGGGIFGSEIIEIPGQITLSKEIYNAPHGLPEIMKHSLLQDLVPLAAAGFMCRATAELAADVQNHAFGCDQLTIFREFATQRICAFIAGSFVNNNGLSTFHLEGIIMDPGIQNRSVGFHLLSQALHDNQSQILTFHTQSKAMESLGKQISAFDIDTSVFVAGLIGTKNLSFLPSGEPIDKGRYGGCLYGDVEKFAPLAIRRQGFNFLEGDAIIFAGHVDGGTP